MNDDHRILLAAATRLADRNVKLREFLLRLIDPEDLGHAVTPEVRRLALMLATNQDATAMPVVTHTGK